MNENEQKVISILGKKHKKEESIDLSDKERENKIEESKVDFEPLYCSFCGRPNTQVVKMVKGPGVNICSECTLIAVQYLILDDKMPSGEAQKILDTFWSNF